MIDTSAANQKYISVSEAALILGCAPLTLRNFVSKRAIAHIRLGSERGKIMFTMDMIDDFVQSRTVQPAMAKAA
jgi:hypothetical protein